MIFFLKKINKKEKDAIERAIKGPNPFIGAFSNLNKEIKTWFEFLEWLVLTGLLVYFSQKTHNIALRFLVGITLFIWLVKIMSYFFLFERLILHLVLIKSKLWWQFITLSFILIGFLFYLTLQFIDLFKLLH